MFRKDIILRLSSVEREFRACRLAVFDLIKRSTIDPSVLYVQDVTNSDIRACRETFE
jgi:hypothetical protein